MQHKIISLQIPQDLYEAVQKAASSEGISVSAVVRRLLIREYKKERTDEYKE